MTPHVVKKLLFLLELREKIETVIAAVSDFPLKSFRWLETSRGRWEAGDEERCIRLGGGREEITSSKESLVLPVISFFLMKNE